MIHCQPSAFSLLGTAGAQRGPARLGGSCTLTERGPWAVCVLGDVARLAQVHGEQHLTSLVGVSKQLDNLAPRETA